MVKGVHIFMKVKLSMISTIIMCAALITTGCAPSCPDIDGKAPDFTLENVHGESISLRDLEGKIVMLNFWATWCGPCLIEIPHLQAVYDSRSGEDLVLLAIDIGESASTVKKFIDDRGITFPILLDTQAKVANKYCLSQVVPQTLFIDDEGILRARKIGAFQSQGEIESILDSL
jgi:peroxiredoxin